MDANTFDEIICSLQSKRPLRVVRQGAKEIHSIEVYYSDRGWEHTMSIPRSEIFRERHDDYRTSRGQIHRSLKDVYHKLLTLNLISPNEKSKFLS